MSSLQLAAGGLCVVVGMAAVALAGRAWPVVVRGRHRRPGRPVLAPEPVALDGGGIRYAALTRLGVVPMDFRRCPEEDRTVACYAHQDGTATCADPDCGAHIPAGEAA